MEEGFELHFGTLSILLHDTYLTIPNATLGAMLTITQWALSIFTNLVEFGLGFIPVVGPLLAIEFSITVTAITDPEYFESDNVLGLLTDTIHAVLDAAEDSKKYVTPGIHFADPGSSEARSAARGANGTKAREARVKRLRQQAEQIGWGPAGWFADRVKGLHKGKQEAVAKDSDPKSLTANDYSPVGQAPLKYVQSSPGSTLVQMQISCENLQMKEHTMKFH